MQLIDNSTKTIITTGHVFEHPKEFPSGQEYVSHFPFKNSIQKQRNMFVCCKIESEIRVRKFKYGGKSIMHTPIENNTFLRSNKYNTYQEDCIEWFKYINLILTLQRTKRDKLTEALFNI